MIHRLILAITWGSALAVGAVMVARADQARDAGACYSIPDADTRAMCLAFVRRDPGMCYAIQDPVLRAQCGADVRR